MAETKYSFDNAAAYERYMGRWSRAIGENFLEWLAPPIAARWLDLGCGTGAFTELVCDCCSPSEIVAVDPAAAQIESARRLPIGQRAEFRVADALSLPFPDRSFDIVASALVINFIPDQAGALVEMRRVARPGGLVGGYVWDLANNSEPASPLRRSLHAMGVDNPSPPGTASSTRDALHALFEAAGFNDIAVKPIDVTLAYRDFDEFWDAQTPSFSPTTKIIAALTDDDRARLRAAVEAELSASAGGKISHSARANAIKARVP